MAKLHGICTRGKDITHPTEEKVEEISTCSNGLLCTVDLIKP